MNCPHCHKPLRVRVTIHDKNANSSRTDFDGFAREENFDSSKEMFHHYLVRMGRTQEYLAKHLGVGLSTLRRRLKKEGEWKASVSQS